MDEDKVAAILSWPTHKNANEVRIFHGLAQYYRNSISYFNGICASMMDTIKGGIKTKIVWIRVENKGFETLKKEVATKPILMLPNFNEPFFVECDASNIVVGGVLSQRNRLVAFFIEKINAAKQK